MTWSGAPGFPVGFRKWHRPPGCLTGSTRLQLHRVGTRTENMLFNGKAPLGGGWARGHGRSAWSSQVVELHGGPLPGSLICGVKSGPRDS